MCVEKREAHLGRANLPRVCHSEGRRNNKGGYLGAIKSIRTLWHSPPADVNALFLAVQTAIVFIFHAEKLHARLKVKVERERGREGERERESSGKELKVGTS